jgi:phage-related baseplate assembly protein
MPLLSDLISVETRESVNATLLSIAASLGLKTTSWQSGGTIRVFLATVAQKFADYTAVKREIVRGVFLELAEGDWLAFTAEQRYGVTKRPARAATGNVTLTNTDAQTYNLPPGDLIVAHSVTGKTYRNTAAISLPTGVLENVPVQADEVGTASDAAPGLVTALVTSLVGVTVTNPDALLGANLETDPELKARAKAEQQAISAMGPKGVYHAVATSPTLSPTASPITRTGDSLDTTTGLLTVYLATATGAPIPADVAIVQSAYDEWAEPMGFLATAAASAELVVPVTATIVVDSSLTDVEIGVLVESALGAYFATLPIGGYVVPPDSGLVFADGIRSAIRGAVDGIVKTTLTLPAADVAIAPGQVAVLGTVTLTIARL